LNARLIFQIFSSYSLKAVLLSSGTSIIPTIFRV
jgi:hypothetical protein